MDCLTLEESAAKLRVCAKTLARFLKKSRVTPPLYAKRGSKYIISPDDHIRIYEAMKGPCPSDLSKDPKVPPTITYEVPSEVKVSMRLQALTTKKPLRPFGSKRRLNSSNVVSLGKRPQSGTSERPPSAT